MWLLFLFLFSAGLFAEEPISLINQVDVRKNSVTVFPSAKFIDQFGCQPSHRVFYYDSEIDLRTLDDAVVVMPFICEVLTAVLSSNQTYVVDWLDIGFIKSIEKLRTLLRLIYPKNPWIGQLICKNKVELAFDFINETQHVSCFSGGVDSVYALISQLDTTKRLMVVKGHCDTSTNSQWQKTTELIDFIKETFSIPVSTLESSAFPINHYHCPDISSWELEGKGNLRWVGKALPLMIHYKIPSLCIPSTLNYRYPYLPDLRNIVTCQAVSFGNGLTVFEDDFEISRSEKIFKILNYVGQGKQFELKVCLDYKESNCSFCAKCIRTINDIYLFDYDPNNFGFKITLDQAKKRTLALLQEFRSSQNASRTKMNLFMMADTKLHIEKEWFLGGGSFLNWYYDVLKQDPLIGQLDMQAEQIRTLERKLWNVGY